MSEVDSDEESDVDIIGGDVDRIYWNCVYELN